MTVGVRSANDRREIPQFGSFNWYFFRNASKLQSSPWHAFDAINIVRYRIKLFSFFDDLDWRDENEFGFSGSINREINHGHATRSIFGRSVIGRGSGVFISFGARHVRSFVCCQRLRVDSRFDSFG